MNKIRWVFNCISDCFLHLQRQGPCASDMIENYKSQAVIIIVLFSEYITSNLSVIAYNVIYSIFDKRCTYLELNSDAVEMIHINILRIY